MKDLNKDLNTVTGSIVDSAVRIHSKLGPGLVEAVYESVLARDLMRRGLHVERQKTISFRFEDLHFEDACRCDIVVEQTVIVEVKSVSKIITLHEQQLLTYLRLLDCKLGLILNFGAPLMKEGIKRIANGYRPSLQR
ncbi:MAG TPA: GxxExxY protein [Longimicrobiales bacterium]